MDLQHPLDWAYSQPLKPATKFILVTMAKVARPEYFCAVSTLCDLTGLNRKTVFSSLDDLQRLGLIADTGKRTGKTGQIVVYKLSTEPYLKRNSTKTGTVPLFPPNSPKNGIRSKSPKNGTRIKDIKYKKRKEFDVSHHKSQNNPKDRPRSMSEIMGALKIATKGNT